MNYRHSFHAGNHTEVFKHSVLALVIQCLKEKKNPFFVLDTHAGPGLYDLTDIDAKRTGEAHNGIGKVIHQDLRAALPYLQVVREINRDGLRWYPGSPKIVQSLLRGSDRLAACELHPYDVTLLQANFNGDRRVSIHYRDGYEAIRALLPPRERRGVVFIDPPFEAKDEMEQLTDAIVEGLGKWQTGIFVGWYPIKTRSAARVLRNALRSSVVRKSLLTEFIRYPEDGKKLAGSGLVICNPPWRLDNSLRTLAQELSAAFGAPRGRWSVEWLRGDGDRTSG